MREAERLLAVARKPEGDQLVFTDQWRQPLHGRHITERRLSAVLRKADLRRIRFHDLRHTAATLMLLQGVNPKVVSEMLGHTTVEMTLDTYSHVLPTMQEDAVSRLDELLGA